MKYLHKVNKSITLLLFLIAISYLPTFAQNTAPVPTTFDILSPSNGILPLQINHDYGTGTSQNNRIFYGGDFSLPKTSGVLSGFQGWKESAGPYGLTAMSELVARGNHSKSRLTLGSTEDRDGLIGSIINNLPGGHPVGSFDPQDLGDGALTSLNYSGMNGFIAVNEEDTLTIRLTGYIDPNNTLVYPNTEDYSGAMLKSESYVFDIGHPANDDANGVRFDVIPSTLPAGATFNGSIFSWVPNFIQGDGTFDNSVRNGIFFIDANISNGSTVAEVTNNTAHDTVRYTGGVAPHAWVGQGKGELRDSLYVVYFSATDDGIPPKTGVDSLFILVSDSIANPPPVFTSRQVINRQGQAVSYLKNSVHFISSTADSLLRYSEGDSLVITFYATDQDSIRGGGANQRLTFAVEKWNDFAPSQFTLNGTKSFSTAMNAKLDSAAMRVDTVFVGGAPRGLRISLQLAYNIASATPERADSLIIRVTDQSSNYRLDTMLFRIANVNRYPIWDADTSSKPADSSLVFSYAPETVYPDSVGALQNIAVSSGKTDSVYFGKYVYDPDFLIGDQLGTAVTFTQSGSIEPIWNGTSGLMVLSLETADTVSYAFTITTTDNNLPVADRKASSRALFLRVAPTPAVAEVYPHSGYPGLDITIFGSGFGLFNSDTASTSTSRVVFRSRNSIGTPQNIQATINSWSRDRINITIPKNVSESLIDVANGVYIPDTIEVYSGVFSNPAYYPYVIGAADSTAVKEIEIVNLTSTSAVIKWKTAFTGGDSVIVASIQDTLQIFSTSTFTEGSTGFYWPTFVQKLPVSPWTMTTNRAAVQVFKGTTSGADQIHYVQLTNLTAQTTYQYILGMQNKIFFGDSAHNINGPYFPKKIDRKNVDANNGNISGFRFKTLPEQNVNGSTHTITGKVFTTNGAAVNALVTVKIISHANVGDTSMALTAIVGNDSSWVVNLGDAITDTSGVVDRKFPYETGDFLLVTVTADKDVGYAQFITTVGSATPQSVNSGDNGTRLSASVNYDMRLKPGLNLIGIPVSLFATEPQTSDELLTRMKGGTPTITRYNSATGTQQTRIKAITAGGGYLGDAVFNLELYKAYFVGADQMEYVTLSGSVFGDTLPVQIFDGAGLYWISRPAQISSLFYAWSARSMLSNIANASEVFRYDEDTQMYENAIIDPNTGAFVNTDFHIDVSEGYILHITASSQWDINTPTATLLANADAFFAKASGITTPSMVLDLSKENPVAGSGAVRNVRLSNVTSSAAAVSWITEGNIPAEIRYGKVANGLNMVAKFENNMLEGGVRMVQLLGLEPETEYAYEIVSNGITYNDNGRPFTFKSAKVGIGQPYTVFGRLVDDVGKPLARAIVYVELKNEDKVSVALADLTDKDGYWNVNLANLKVAGEGTVFGWGAGNDMRITVVFGNNSASYRTKVSGESPQNVVKSGDYELAQEKQEVAPVSLPKAFGLAQNYPNPFNPSTTIAYDIPESNPQGVNVELKVYNLRGQVIRTLANDMKTPGHYIIQWNGANENGETVSSGVYFYRIKAGNYVATRKMVLLK